MSFDREAHGRNAWDWGFLDEACPGRIRVSDVDGILTYGQDRVLIIEAKPEFDIGKMAQGQWMTLCRLAARGCDVLVVYGDSRTSTPTRMRRMHAGGGDEITECSQEILQAEVAAWFANGGAFE